MARTIKEIQSNIITEKDKRLELNELNSSSKVSIYNGWAYVSAVAIHSFEVIHDTFKADIETTLENRINGTPQYYVNKALEYQDGDNLEVSPDGTRVGYPIINTDNRIITRASFEESVLSVSSYDKLLIVKVAKGDIGALVPLDGEELLRFKSYLEQIKFAGTNISPVSKTGDVLIPRITVYHDGLLTELSIRTAVNAKIHEYIGDLSFDSSLYISKLFDAIATIDNVTDVYADPSAMPAQGVFVRSYTDGGVLEAEQSIGRVFIPSAGFLRESSKAGLEELVDNFDDAIIIKSDIL